ncbi:Hsp90 ATPase activator family protein, putative [Synechococcus sp. PCC 7335]|uniref:SRPBCC family protein n=1 Tax=Synechococcus sp. (strain ATCC 29403 / PCC 7335) TaxID=91464 RepID=UPI00017EC0E9|nr:SRPBCC domain-containing protein [Synechococcus sp. PCC 7335]EDX82425.1 Hsp90 ATPase activator family protein, putative [Synechococcus sp. PCC 7335]
MTDLVLDESYPYPPEKVWQALTDSRALAAWLMDNDFKPCLGHRFQFVDSSSPGLKTVIDCEVIELESPKRLVYSWQVSGMSDPSIVTWTLTPIQEGTQVQLHHSGLLQNALIKVPSPVASSTQLKYSSEQPNGPLLSALSIAHPDKYAQPQAMTVGHVDFLETDLEMVWKQNLQERLSKVLVQL